MGNRSVPVCGRDDLATCPAACPVLPLSEGCLKYWQCQSSQAGSYQPQTSRSVAGAVGPPVSATAAQEEQQGAPGGHTAMYQQPAVGPLSLGRPTSYQLPAKGRQKERKIKSEPSLHLLKPPQLIWNLTDHFELPSNSSIHSSTHTALMRLQVSCHSAGDLYSSALHTLSNTYNLELNQPVHMLLKNLPWSRPAPGAQLGHLCSWPFKRSCKTY